MSPDDHSLGNRSTDIPLYSLSLSHLVSGRNQRVLVQPINVIFKHLQSGTKVAIWLFDNIEQRIEGKIIGFDEFMNVVIDDAEEVWVKDTKSKKSGDRNLLGRLLLKGENITLIQQANVA